MDKFEEARALFPAAQQQVYLNTPTSGLLSVHSFDAMQRKLEKSHMEGGSIRDYWQAWRHADQVRVKMAAMINASDEEIFFGKDASDMLNAFVANIDIAPGANVLIPEVSFPSTRNAWLNRERDGLCVRYIAPTAGVVRTEDILAHIDDKTLAVSICAVEPSSGYAYDLELLSKVCREKNIFLVVDSTQSLGVMAYDMQKTPIDVLVSSAYKWMNNVFGLGIGYMRKDIIERLTPCHVGWTGTRDRKRDFNNLALTFSDTATKFETGGLNWMALAGLEQSIDMYMQLGKEAIQTHSLDLVCYLYEQLETLGHVRIQPAIKEQNRSAIVYLKMADALNMTEQDFADKGIRLYVAGKKIRLGIHLYNNREDIDKLVDVLKAIV